MSNKYDEVDKFRDSLSRGAAEPRAEFLSQLKAEFISRAERTSRLNNLYTHMRNLFSLPQNFARAGLAASVVGAALLGGIYTYNSTQQQDKLSNDELIAKIVAANPQYSALVDPNNKPQDILPISGDELKNSAGAYYQSINSNTYTDSFQKCRNAQKEELFLSGNPGKHNERSLTLLLTGDNKQYSKYVLKSDGEIAEINITLPEETYRYVGGKYAISQKDRASYGPMPEELSMDSWGELKDGKIVDLAEGRKAYEFKWVDKTYFIECGENDINASSVILFDANSYKLIGFDIFLEDNNKRDLLWEERYEETYRQLDNQALQKEIKEIDYRSLPYEVVELESADFIINTKRKTEVNEWLASNGPLLVGKSQSKIASLLITELSNSFETNRDVRSFYADNEYGQYLFDKIPSKSEGELYAGDYLLKANWNDSCVKGDCIRYSMLATISDQKAWLVKYEDASADQIQEITIKVGEQSVTGYKFIHESGSTALMFNFGVNSYVVNYSNVNNAETEFIKITAL